MVYRPGSRLKSINLEGVAIGEDLEEICSLVQHIGIDVVNIIA